MTIDWTCQPFHELSVKQLYTILAERQAVFIVEQNCPFQEMDGLDAHCWHLSGWQAGQLVAYCRIVPPGVKFAVPSIGRVLTNAAWRGHGYGILLMQQAIKMTQELFPDKDIMVAAQTYLENFYNRFGFERFAEIYEEDNISHIDMLRKNSAKEPK